MSGAGPPPACEAIPKRIGAIRRGLLWSGLAAATLLGVVTLVWRDDIIQALLDPQIPYTVYKAPPAPDYGQAGAWAALPGPVTGGDPPADIFFVHPTTFDGGRDWNGPISDGASARLLTQVMLPNYAAPFASLGRLFAPRYRQASLFTSLSVFDDAIEAREFAYGDVRAAFRALMRSAPRDRPFFLVGVEQGGDLAARLLREEIASDASLRRRLVAAYFIETVTPADAYGPRALTPACAARSQSGCVLAWISAGTLDFVRSRRVLARSMVWNDRGRLNPLGGREPLCVNPLLGAVGGAFAPARLNLGAAYATGLEWGARPGFMARQVSAQCQGGILRVSRPRSNSLRPSGGWGRRHRAPPYNLFWADLEADARARLNSWRSVTR